MRETSLSHFLAVAEYKNFKAAAKACNISQPALSRSIQTLEAELSVCLFERSNKSVSLTEAGNKFLFHARNIETQFISARKELDLLQFGDLKSFHIGVGTPVLRFVSRACAKFAMKYPDIKQHLFNSDWYEVTEKLKAGRLDLIVSNIDNYRNDKDLRIVDLSPTKLIFYAKIDHPIFKQNKYPTAVDVARYPIVAGILPQSLNPMFSKMFNVENANDMVTVNCETMHEMVDYVKSDNVIGTCCINLLHPFMMENKVRPIILPEMDFERTYYSIVSRKSQTLHPKLVELISMIRKAERLEGVQ